MMQRKAMLTCLALACLLAFPALAVAATFYVSPAGNDAWSGALAAPNAAKTDGPFATLERARDAVRALKAKGPLAEPVKVVLRGGVYELPKPLALTPQDSGTEACPVTYAAAPGEKPVVSGGRRIRGWRKAKRELWEAKLPVGMRFRQLFVNGQRRTLARCPNEGYFRIVGKAAPIVDAKTGKERDSSKLAFRFKPGDIKAWPDLNEIDAVIYRNWETGTLRLKSVDTQANTVTFTGPMKWAFRARQRYYIENAPDALDAPGEWQIDRAADTLRYWPKPGEDMTHANVVAPALAELVTFKGEVEAGLPVEHIRFDGISFQHAAYRLEPGGHGDWQAAVTIPAAIHANGAQHVTILRCEVAHFGPYGIWFERACSYNRIEQCEVHDMGAGGVRFGEQRPRKGALATHHNVVTNCFIHDIGHLFPGAIGVWIGQSSDNEVTHNEICDTGYSGISVGWSWGFRPTTCHRNKIEFNHIHHISCGALYDLGAIYTLGISTGTTIRYNRIHDVWDWAEGYGAGGIYPDEGSSGILIENNVVYRTTAGGLTVHYGRDNVVRNNIFAFGRDRQIGTGRKDKKSSLTFVNNIVYCDWPDDGKHIMAGTDNITSDHNVFYNASGEQVLFIGNATFSEWQAKGFDKHSVVADPMFADPKADDFRLRPESPALKLGFKPIDLSKVGLYGPSDWVDKPKHVKRAVKTMPPARVVKPQLIDDGFELSPVRTTADMAITYGETAAATIRVTDEIAASGKKCLKFTDAPGLRYTWAPHIYYQPHIRKRVVRLSFDLRFEPGAKIWHEWRDRSSPYRVGPSMGVDAKGVLNVRKGPKVPLPANEWIHFEITCGMGKQATGTYDLALTLPGQPPKRFDKLPCDPKCRQLEWLGFVSDATDRRVFYLDNVKLELLK